MIRRYPLISFFVLAFVFSWWPWPLDVLGLAPSPLIGFGPFLAAVVVLASTGGRAAVVALLHRTVRWRVRPLWYAVALVLPLVLAASATLLNVLLGAGTPTRGQLLTWPALVPTFFLLLLVPGIGGAWEEPGWRGFAQPKLQVSYSALAASLVLGVIWAVWHVPLMIKGTIPFTDLIFVVASTVVFTWLLNNTAGSVLLAMLMHTMNNVVGGGFFTPMFSGADRTRQGWLIAAVWCAAAIGIVIASGSAHLSRTNRRQMLAASGQGQGGPAPLPRPTSA